MNVELVKTVTSDDVRLDGAWHAPAAEASSEAEWDAFIFLHGVGSNFYRPALWQQLTPRILMLGISVLWANTRGHDTVTSNQVQGRPKRLGAAYEIVDDCRLDIQAWQAFLRERGHRRIGLLGHSLGALKAIYAQAFQTQSGNSAESAGCIIAISPPRLSYTCFTNSQQSSLFFESIRNAERMVQEGNPDQLLEVQFPVPMLMAAGSYVDKYGRQERYNLTRFIDRVTCPALYTYGQRELEQGGVAFAGVPDAIRDRTVADRTTIVTIAGADHFYGTAHDDLADEICRWLDPR